MRLRGATLALATALLLALPAGAQANQTLSVEKVGSGTGTVTSSPEGINCGITCTAPFANGTTLTLTAASGPNTEAVKWSGCDTLKEGKCIVTMSGPRSITASFKLNQRQLAVSKGGVGTGTVTSSPTGINCGSICSASFGEGQTIALTGVSGAGALPVQWSGCDSISAEGKCLVTMTEARSVGAVFNVEGPSLSLTESGNGAGAVTSAPAGLSCPGTCQVSFPKGATVTLTATPGLHTEAVKWSGCESEPAGHCVVTMSTARSVNANFTLQPGFAFYTVAIERTGRGTGTVQGSPGGIECGLLCAAEYITGTQLSFEATPAPGSAFAHWSGGDCATVGAGPCTITLKGPTTLKATFVLAGKRTLSVSKSGSGRGTVIGKKAGIECGAVCSAELQASGRVLSLRATPAPGSKFAGWSGEGCSGTKACRVQMTQARNVTASFTLSAGPGASQCLVPRLTGKTLAKARKALGAANCTLGRIRKPKHTKLSHLRVRSSTPAAGSVLTAGGAVGLRLGRAKAKR